MKTRKIKKLKVVLYFAFLFFVNNLISQNLILNPSFEDSSENTIPSKKFNEIYIEGSQICNGWFQATQASSDVFNSNESTVPLLSLCLARSGNGRAGIITGHGKSYSPYYNKNTTTQAFDYSEYLETKLTRPLYKDSVYEISFYITLHKSSKKYSKKVGFVLTDTIIKKSQKIHLYLNPSYVCEEDELLKSKTEWKLIHTTYKAKGGEKYLTIGKFNNDDFGYFNDIVLLSSPLERIYYYVDDVAVINTQDTATYHRKIREQEGTANHFVYLIDASASMLVGNNFQLMQQQVKKQIALLNPYDKVSLFAFAEKPQAMVKSIRANDTAVIFSALKNISINGITKLENGLQNAVDFLSNNDVTNGSNHILIATDGLFKIKKSFRKKIGKYTSDKNIGISTIFLGKKTNKALEKLCRKNAGFFMPIKINSSQNNTQDFINTRIYKPLESINKVKYNNNIKAKTDADFGY